MLKEMCSFSNRSTSANVKVRNEQGHIVRKNGGLQGGLNSHKKVVEDYQIDLDGDFGENGRPRIKEEVKLPPEYENIDLCDPNDEVLF